MARGGFVAEVDEVDALVSAAFEQRLVMAAVQREILVTPASWSVCASRSPPV